MLVGRLVIREVIAQLALEQGVHLTLFR